MSSRILVPSFAVLLFAVFSSGCAHSTGSGYYHTYSWKGGASRSMPVDRAVAEAEDEPAAAAEAR